MTNKEKAIKRAHKARTIAARKIDLLMKREIPLTGREHHQMMAPVKRAYGPSIHKIGLESTIAELQRKSPAYRKYAARVRAEVRARIASELNK